MVDNTPMVDDYRLAGFRYLWHVSVYFVNKLRLLGASLLREDLSIRTLDQSETCVIESYRIMAENAICAWLLIYLTQDFLDKWSL